MCGIQLNPIAAKLLFLTSSLTLLPLAQADNTKDSEESEDIERIEITGSRMKRLGAIAPTPVTVISGDAIRSAGINNLGDLLNNIPSSTTSISPATSNNYIFASGLNITSLRGLGSDRTLVLLNGRRFISGSPGSGGVDLNNIPSALIKRVDIVTGGASAVYGSDAVAGVVNIITKKSYNGVEVTGSMVEPEQDGGEERELSFTVGSDFADGKGNALFNINYATQEEIGDDDRDFLRDGVYAIDNPSGGKPGRVTFTGRRFYTLYNKQGVFNIGDKKYTFSRDGKLKAFDFGSGVIPGSASNNRWHTGNGDGSDFLEDGFEKTPLDRTVYSSYLTYQLHENHQLFVETTYSTSTAHGESSPVFHRGSSAKTIKLDNAFINADMFELMQANNLSEISLHRAHSEFGAREYAQDRKLFRVAAGFEGNLTENWGYSLYYQKGRNKNTTSWHNQVVTERFDQSLDSIILNGKAVCRDEEARKSGCIAFNPFGRNVTSTDSIDWVSTDVTRLAEAKQESAGLFIDGDLIEIPSGMITAAFGVEWRQEQSETKPDYLMMNNLIFGNKSAATVGKTSVREASMELSVPVVNDVQFVDDLTAELAYRIMDYSNSGREDAWKIGLNWRLNEQLRFRLNRSKSVRAPNISELFNPGGQTFNSISDPCSQKRLDETGPFRANFIKNCRADGIPEGWIPPQSWSSSVAGEITGNKDLTPEISNDYTIGFIYTPDWINDLTITFDYWNFDISNAITSFGGNSIVRNCYRSNSLANSFCGLMRRDPNDHTIEYFNSREINLASFKTSGVDIEINHTQEFGNWGSLETNFIATYVDEWSSNESGFSSDVNEDAGEYSDPYWKGKLQVIWLYEDLQSTLAANYRHSAVTDFGESPQTQSYYHIPSHTTWDATGKYHWDDTISMRFGILNLLDKAPPRHPTVYYGRGYYDIIGRRLLLGFTVKL
ncbi:TonB-dependent receptor plug domain-containing protein [Algicola sagamiensis]|uniref:TonB-dependent receptor plug domain-containing protein n=1 Tax=Algicola sagamiensis TaxID=163869 RepID=UPI00036A75B1|nr:TonB-dependent receptor [Algicola sagamiensis]